jgi:hypothetical protein
MILLPPSREKLCNKYYHARFIFSEFVLNIITEIQPFQNIREDGNWVWDNLPVPR